VREADARMLSGAPGSVQASFAARPA